jgi:hypothetical protein
MLSSLHADVSALATTVRAKANTWFFKTGPGEYGEGDQFAGLTLPQVRSARKEIPRPGPRRMRGSCCTSPLHEERLLAVLHVGAALQSKEDGRGDAESASTTSHLANSAYVNNWDLVDASASYIVGPYLQDKPRDVLLRLAASELVWDRRIAILATFHYIRQGDCTDALRSRKR